MSVTIQELNQITEQIVALRDKEQEAKRAKDEVTRQLEDLERRALDILVENEMTSYRAPAGLLSANRKSSVSLPKNPEDWAKFWQGLRNIGEYDLLVTVNSQKLNSWYKEKDQLAADRGEEFEFPGLNEVKEMTYLSVRRS